MLARFRVKLVVGNRLHAHDRGHAENVMGIRAARNIRRRTVEAEQDFWSLFDKEFLKAYEKGREA